MDAAALSQFAFSGLTTGCIYALVALGYVLCFNATRVINFAQGEYAMVGGLVAASLTSASTPVLVAVLAAILAGALLGMAQERLTLAPVRSSPDYIRITLTLGFAVVVRGLALIFWGKDPYPMAGFSGNDIFELFGAILPMQILWIWGLAILVLAGTFAFLNRTRWGRAVRACSDNDVAARLMGINPFRVSLLVFMIGGGIGALGGAVITPVTLASYGSGLEFGVKGFIGALIGNFNRPGRAVLGGLALGVLETFAAAYVSSGSRDIVVYGLLLVFLVVTSGFLQRGRRALAVAGRA